MFICKYDDPHVYRPQAEKLKHRTHASCSYIFIYVGHKMRNCVWFLSLCICSSAFQLKKSAKQNQNRLVMLFCWSRQHLKNAYILCSTFCMDYCIHLRSSDWLCDVWRLRGVADMLETDTHNTCSSMQTWRICIKRLNQAGGIHLGINIYL